METQESLLEKLLAKTEEDAEFRTKLLAEPRTALQEGLGIQVPADFNVVIHEDDARTAHLVLPTSTELTDAQLERAAGGGICGSGTTDWLESLPGS